MSDQQYPPHDPWRPHPPHGQQPRYGPPPQGMQRPQGPQWPGPQGPQQPPYQQHPQHWVPPRPPGKPRTALWISLAVVGALFTGCVALAATTDEPTGGEPGGGVVAREDPTTDTGGGEEAQGETEKKEPTARIGDVVRDGQFSFTVTKSRRAEVLGENPYLQKEAQGEFVIFSVTVRNHGDEPRDFNAASQELFVGDKKYDAAPDLEGNAFLNTINPGNKVKGRLAFDVPEGAEPTRLVLHDSPFSGGGTVILSE